MEQERSIVAVQEAVAISDYRNQRELMMNIIRKDIKKSLGSITYALNSEDSETSHYAAAALRDELGEFRNSTHKLYQTIKDSKPLDLYACNELVNLIYDTISQDVFRQSEQKSYVWMMEEVFTRMYEYDPKTLQDHYYEWIVSFLMSIGFPEDAYKWFLKAAVQDNSAAQLNIGDCYFEGIGVNQDVNEAKYWYEKADRLGDQRAKEKIILCQNHLMNKN